MGLDEPGECTATVLKPPPTPSFFGMISINIVTININRNLYFILNLFRYNGLVSHVVLGGGSSFE